MIECKVEILNDSVRTVFQNRASPPTPKHSVARTFIGRGSRRLLSKLGCITYVTLSAMGCTGDGHENARNLKLTGLRDLVCKEVPYDERAQACGQRSVWTEADWGVTAYVTVYGIGSIQEAEQIAQFIAKTRKLNKQAAIPINLRIYSSARSAGREPSKAKLLEKDL